MDESSINKIVDNLSKLLTEIESKLVDFEHTNELNELNVKLQRMQKELYLSGVKKEIKKEYNNRILAVKKALVNYYNMLAYLLECRLDRLKLTTDDETINDIEVAPLTEQYIKNAQDKVRVDFNKVLEVNTKISELEQKHHIDKIDNGGPKLEFIEMSIAKVEERIHNIDSERISEQNILLDIDLLKKEIRNISHTYEDNKIISIECEGKLKYLDLLPNELSSSEYSLLKKRLNAFNEELNRYSETKPDIDTILQLEHTYSAYRDEIETYKNKDKQLYINLVKLLRNASESLDKVENGFKGTDNTQTEETDETLHIEQTEDAKDFYKKYEKPILLASGIASLALINTKVGSVLIPAIIFANMIAANKYKVIDKINTILAKSIGAIKGEDGLFSKINGIKITGKEAINSLLKGVASIKTKSKETTISLLNRVKQLKIVVKAKEHISNIKQHIEIKKDELKDLKTIKLYYEFITSNKTPEDFLNQKKLSEDEAKKLIDYMNYKDNLDNKEDRTIGR